MDRGWEGDIADPAGLPADSSVMHLPEGEIHLWHIDLDESTAHETRLLSLLSQAERRAADQFFFWSDRLRFIIRRGALRLILSQYHEISPADLPFRQNGRGKPQLIDSYIHFSASHSAGLAVYALGRCELGVDIERIRNIPDALTIAEAFFSSSERASLEALPVVDQQKAFFRCWTRKEAFVKALGEGLSHPLDQFSVSVSPFASIGVIKTKKGTGWSITDLTLANDWVGALVANYPEQRMVSRCLLLE